ncbi:SMP-30/gluconolactonase/LRE family protein [Synechococcus sp. CS-1332]|uniref:SMP-30/gluconolactonase/LRE family protein n=1 Tax=Synechococcus sp. CS-1332 TaxID=2847972 RepID=UPI00223BF746|nr:gluconolactonase [Synechococcus sp. CS-1332]MCT0207462.1 gluconolactonase [Synechococcus sp. CS-1332]
MSTPAGLPPIFAEVPVAIAPSHPIAEFPPSTFLESIAVSSDGTLFVSSHLDGKVLRIGADGVPVVHAAIAGKATGLALTSAGDLLLTAWDADGIPTIYTISPQGVVAVLVTLPDAIFLNGLTPLSESTYLIADSYRGAIWQLNLADRSVGVWLEHPLLARSSEEREFPAVNGLKIYGQTLYASNTEKMQLIKIPIQPNGQPGEPEIFFAPVNLDDFAFDQEGNLYGTTHIYNSVIKITPDRRITTIAEAEHGMTGSTALAFGAGAGDRTSLYVVTNGGLSFPLPSGLEPAKVVRLDIGIAGHQLLQR